MYSRNIAAALRFYNILQAPLQSAPGEQYCYTNVNFNLAAYIIEKVSNMTYNEYIEANILKPANLSRTIYWPGYWGQQPGGLLRNQATRFGYITRFSRNSDGNSAVYSSVSHADPQDFLFQLSGPSGAMESTAGDLVKFYFTIFSQPEVLGLSTESVQALMAPNTLIPGNSISGSQLPSDQKVYFAQGTSAVYEDGRVKQLQYIGSFGGFQAAITFFYRAEDPSKSDAVTFFTNQASVIPLGTDGSCSVAYNGQKVDLDVRICGPAEPEDFEDLDEPTPDPVVAVPAVMDKLYSIWNAGDYGSPPRLQPPP